VKYLRLALAKYLTKYFNENDEAFITAIKEVFPNRYTTTQSNSFYNVKSRFQTIITKVTLKKLS